MANEPNASLTGRILAALRGHDRDAENQALQELFTDLRQRASGYAPGRGQRVDMQLDSVVQSVVVGALPKAVDRCEDDEGLKRYLGRAVKNRFADRLGRRRAASLDADSDLAWAEPQDSGPSPSSVVFAAERGVSDEAGRVAFEQALAAAPLTAREREISTLFVLRDCSWEQVGAAVKMTAAAAKVAMHRMRPRLLKAVLEPLQPRLSNLHWSLLCGVLIEGRTEVQVAGAAHLEPEQVLAAFRETIVPAIRQAYGSFGVDRLNSLRSRSHRPAAGKKPTTD